MSAPQSANNNVVTTEIVLKTDSTDRKFNIAKFMDKVEWAKFTPPARIRQKKFHWAEKSANENKPPSYYRFRKKNRLFYHKDTKHTWVIEDSTPDHSAPSTSASAAEQPEQPTIGKSVGRRYHKYEGQLEGSQSQQNYVIFVMGGTRGEFRVLQTDKWFSFKPYEPEETEEDVNIESAERKMKKHIEREVSLANHGAVATDQDSSFETESRITVPPKVKRERHGIEDTDVERVADFDEVVSDDEEFTVDQAGTLDDESDNKSEEEEEEEEEDEKLKQQLQQKPTPGSDGPDNSNYGQYMQRLLRKQIDDESGQITRKVKPKKEEEQAEEQAEEGGEEKGPVEKEKVSNKRGRKQQDSTLKKSEPSKKRVKKEEEEAPSAVVTPPPGPSTPPPPATASISTPVDTTTLDVAQLEEKFIQTLRERPRTAREILQIFIKNVPQERQAQIRTALIQIIKSVTVLGEDKKLTLRDSHK